MWHAERGQSVTVANHTIIRDYHKTKKINNFMHIYTPLVSFRSWSLYCRIFARTTPSDIRDFDVFSKAYLASTALFSSSMAVFTCLHVMRPFMYLYTYSLQCYGTLKEHICINTRNNLIIFLHITVILVIITLL